MGIFNFLFGSDSSSDSDRNKKQSYDSSRFSFYGNGYEDIYDAALEGDMEAREIMREEFGDDFEDEPF